MTDGGDDAASVFWKVTQGDPGPLDGEPEIQPLCRECVRELPVRELPVRDGLCAFCLVVLDRDGSS